MGVGPLRGSAKRSWGSSGLRPALGLAARFAGDRLEARPQAPERRVRLRVEAVDRKVAALDQPVLLAQRDRAQEQPLEHVAVGETLRLRLRDRLMRGQPLAEPVTEKEAQIKPQLRHPQQLPHRPDPLQRPRQHQLQKHRRIDRRSAQPIGVIGTGRLPHETPITDQLVDPAKTIILGHQLVKANHRNLPRRLLRPCHTHRHRHASSTRQTLHAEPRTPTGPQTPTLRTRP